MCAHFGIGRHVVVRGATARPSDRDSALIAHRLGGRVIGGYAIEIIAGPGACGICQCVDMRWPLRLRQSVFFLAPCSREIRGGSRRLPSSNVGTAGNIGAADIKGLRSSTLRGCITRATRCG